MRSVLILAAVCAAIALTSTFVSAQPRYGDLLVTSHSADTLAWVDRKSGTMTTLRVLPGDPLPLIMAANNTDVLVFELPSPWSVWNITPAGVMTTVGQASAANEGAVTGCDWRQNGELLTCHSIYGKQGWLRSLNLTSNTYTTLFTGTISHFRHAAVSTHNGNPLVCRATTGGQLMEFDLQTKALSTVATGINNATCVDIDPASGNYLVTEEGFGDSLKIVNQAGSILKTVSIPEARGVKCDDATSTYFVATSTTGSRASSILEVDAKGTITRTYGPYGTLGFAGIEIYGSRQVHGTGPATPGSKYKVDFCFPGVGPIFYVAALSFSQSPGFTVGGQRVNLSIDGLCIASLQGLFVSGFQGQLDANGRASGSINLPSFAPKGLRIYCAAVATNGTSFLAGSTIGITVQ